ncbi:unnamed protein product [Eruca vesicaria subsp. sativa]|uniref:Legume lectin domain-containing protein n=1 Tax=Eruca vesicaria subsp. sativa TaxID=29727 RepID=A0ABC8M5B5_ERUVS|nr:unnamed protein product [Eruca vesicaria subsp. sativa]
MSCNRASEEEQPRSMKAIEKRLQGAIIQLLRLWMLASVQMISIVLAQDGNQFVYYDFRKADLYVDGMATTKDGRLKLTNSSKRATGHALYNKPITFVDSSFSFSTEFVFAIVPEERTSYGQGMAFVVSPSINDLRYGAATSYLGIFNRTNDNKTENHILAIEFDTNASSEALEDSDNHVGIDINSIVSVESKDASYFDDTVGLNKSLVLASKERIHIWIEYDGDQRLLNVTLAPLEIPKPSLPLLSRSVNLSQVFKEQMFFGFSGSTGTIRSHQYILGWSLAVGGKARSLDISQVLDLPQPPPNHLPLILAVAAVVTFLIIAGGIAYLYQRNRYAEVFEQWELKYSPQRFSFRTLYKATKGFKENRVLGAGGFGKNDPHKRPTMKDITEYLEQKKRLPYIAFDTAEFGIPIVPIISDETVIAQGPALSFASFLYDTITVLFRGR